MDFLTSEIRNAITLIDINILMTYHKRLFFYRIFIVLSVKKKMIEKNKLKERIAKEKD